MNYTRRTFAVASYLCFSLVVFGCPSKKNTTRQPKAKSDERKPKLDVQKPQAPSSAEPSTAMFVSEECAATIKRAPVTDVQFGQRTAKLSGSYLTFDQKDADESLIIGVLGPINEDSGTNMVALKKYVQFFTNKKADAILVTGDVGESASSITRVLKVLGSTMLPVFVIIGNRECLNEYTAGVNAAKTAFTNIINLNQVRVVEFPELTFISLPGHHDPKYMNCASGCLYLPSTVKQVERAAKDAKTPVALVSHGPPRGVNRFALDVIGGNINVGDEAINSAIIHGNIAFGFHSNIKEAGARATKDAAGTQQLREGEASESLYLNPGPADATVAWEMNDGSKSVGIAAVFTLQNGKGSYRLLRLKSPTDTEKAEAKRLEPSAVQQLTAPTKQK